jgi:phage terminase large subunit
MNDALTNPTDEELEAAFCDDIKNPLKFHTDILGRGPLWSRQKELLLAPQYHHRIAVKGGYNVGKTYTMGEIGLNFLYAEPDSILITTAPTGRQVKKLLWGEIRRAVNRSKVNLGGTLLDLSLTIDDDWYAIGFSTDDPQNVQGFHGRRVMVIIDEASGVDDEVIENLEGAVSGDNAWLIMSGNPLQARGKFFEAFSDPSFHKITIPCRDHPNVKEGREVFPGMVTKQWCDERKVRWGEESPLYIARVDAEFPQSGSDQLILITWAHKAQHNELESNPNDPIEAGLDIAEEGGDEIVFTARKGPRVLCQEAWSLTDLDATVGKTVRLVKEWNVQKLKTDRIGIGAGPTTTLKNMSKRKEIPCEVIGVNVALPAMNPEEFANVRAEIAFNVADRARDGQLDLTALKNSEELVSQMTTIRKGLTTKGQQTLESKKDLKARGKPSPDRFDSLCLAYAKVRGAPVLGKVHTS